MTKHLEHRGYAGTIEVDLEDGNLYGTVLNIAGDIFYEGDTVEELAANMRTAIDDYIATCERDNVKPDRPFNGELRVRVQPRTHARIAAEAESRGVSMNRVIDDALAARFDSAS